MLIFRHGPRNAPGVLLRRHRHRDLRERLPHRPLAEPLPAPLGDAACRHRGLGIVPAAPVRERLGRAAQTSS